MAVGAGVPPNVAAGTVTANPAVSEGIAGLVMTYGSTSVLAGAAVNDMLSLADPALFVTVTVTT
ncbi:hypothetical protein CG51_18525 [Haematobacter missouriensis]|uniref:Uncharacterized protein n=1 Tax=Haematobacter missouriensis TaxID=366616 RepID=A0ABX3ZR93_9RHOB|nr:hypothetical protein CG51_18525 [Haematobacter missouriensis]OWJ74277.1 hypothetical protein CDV53_13975 [Haematobacter missouriensis]